MKKSWADARKTCLRQNADLVVIDNAEENQHILSLVKRQRSNKDYWIGLIDVDGQDIFKWIAYNSTLQNYTYWVKGEPTNVWNGQKEDCVEMRKIRNFKWNDVPCNDRNGFICERGEHRSIVSSSRNVFIAGRLHQFT